MLAGSGVKAMRSCSTQRSTRAQASAPVCGAGSRTFRVRVRLAAAARRAGGRAGGRMERPKV